MCPVPSKTLQCSLATLPPSCECILHWFFSHESWVVLWQQHHVCADPRGCLGCLHVQLSLSGHLSRKHSFDLPRPPFAPPVWEDFWSCLRGLLCVPLLFCELEFVSRWWAHPWMPFLSYLSSVTCHKPSSPVFRVLRAIISSLCVSQRGEQTFLLTLPLM